VSPASHASAIPRHISSQAASLSSRPGSPCTTRISGVCLLSMPRDATYARRRIATWRVSACRIYRLSVRPVCLATRLTAEIATKPGQ
jgi:hypothetical protein